ncbi:putative ABC transporter permease [uncultured Clostridium sp.]|uniref:putative ABC transporter permease n=1 Tax=uncultured Clostridium sp. TaxID=59620 RepID=UPI002597FEE4|nr:hypothetical protein [uncultured Clostridium sp.]
MKKWLKKEFFIFIIFSISYFTLEILYRGYSHWTMIFLGGIVSVLIGLINEITPNMRMWKQMFLGTILITVLEFILGYILNIKLGLGIWDYSNIPFNIMGQICLPFSFLWFVLSYFIIMLDDILKETF